MFCFIKMIIWQSCYLQILINSFFQVVLYFCFFNESLPRRYCQNFVKITFLTNNFPILKCVLVGTILIHYSIRLSLFLWWHTESLKQFCKCFFLSNDRRTKMVGILYFLGLLLIFWWYDHIYIYRYHLCMLISVCLEEEWNK